MDHKNHFNDGYSAIILKAALKFRFGVYWTQFFYTVEICREGDQNLAKLPSQ